MTPAQQIKADQQELEGQISKLILDFEQRTGVCVSYIGLVFFAQGKYRQHGQPLNLHVTVELPSEINNAMTLDT